MTRNFGFYSPIFSGFQADFDGRVLFTYTYNSGKVLVANIFY